MSAHDGEVMLVTHDGVDTLHPDPEEQCNSDDAEHRGWVDELTAEKLVQTGQAHWCRHCGGEHLAQDAAGPDAAPA